MDRPGAAPFDAEELRASIGRFVRRVRSADGMPSGHPAVLGALVRDGDRSITELAEAAGVKHQSMARTVKLLAEAGSVEVLVDPEDRRRAIVRATTAGRRRLAAERTRRAAHIDAAAAASLTADERAVLARIPAILDKLSAYED